MQFRIIAILIMLNVLVSTTHLLSKPLRLLRNSPFIMRNVGF